MLKPLFLLLLVLFGAAMFAAGALAPAHVKAPLEAFASKIAAGLPMGGKPQGKATDTAIARAGAGTRTAAPSGAASAASGVVYAASAPMADLLVPAVPPVKARYALQAASFESGDAATALAAELAARGHRTVIIPVSDADHPLIVAVGDFPTPEAARAQQLALGEELKSVALAPVIMLPAAH